MRIRDRFFPEGTMARKILRKIRRMVVMPKEEKRYMKWIKHNEPTLDEISQQRKTVFEYNPKISILVPMYNTPYMFFKDLVDSLINQTYYNWELCLADGSEKTNKELEEIYKQDKRIKYKFIGENKGIAGNTNECLKMATGDFIALLDHDDILPIFSLYEIVKCINENPEVEFIYTDEDKFTTLKEPRFFPVFKPDFSLDFLRANNYICHLCVYRKELMDKLGGERSKYDEAQDYDLLLRMYENVNDIKNIIHIPKILYHWRVHPNSSSQPNGGGAKPYTYEAGRISVEDHLIRMGIKCKVEFGACWATYRLKYEFEGNPKVSIIIPNKDGKKALKRCIDSILTKTTYSNYEILIIENNSKTKEIFDYYKELEKNKNIKVIEYKEKEFNCSKIINFGIKEAKGEYIVQLNKNTQLETPDWIEDMLGFASREDVGAVGVKVLYPNHKIQHSGIVFGGDSLVTYLFRGLRDGKYAYLFKYKAIQNFNAVKATCMMTKKSIYEEVGYMDESFSNSFNDLDFCLKVRQTGKLIVYDPFVSLINYESKSRNYKGILEKNERFGNEIKRFQNKWKGIYEKRRLLL